MTGRKTVKTMRTKMRPQRRLISVACVASVAVRRTAAWQHRLAARSWSLLPRAAYEMSKDSWEGGQPRQPLTKFECDTLTASATIRQHSTVV